MEEDPEAKILFLTTFSDDEYIVKALAIGVKGYILKQDFEGIVPSIKAVSRGQSVFGGEIVSKLPVWHKQKQSFATKTTISMRRNRKLLNRSEWEKVIKRLQMKCIYQKERCETILVPF